MSKRQRRRQARRRRHTKQIRLRRRRAVAGAVLSLGAALGMISTAEADDFTVSNTGDAGAGSLRQALTDSNNNNSPTVDRILFQSGLTGTISLASALPLIDEPLEVLGPGADRLTVSGNNARRSFAFINVPPVLDGEAVLISGLRLASGASGTNMGGAIFSQDTVLTLEGMTISGNDSGDDGAGVAQTGGMITIRNSTISGNDATGATAFGGGVSTDAVAVATVQNSTISGNDAEQGGGIYMAGAATIQNSTIADNGAHFGGGLFEVMGAPVPVLTNTIVADNGVSGLGPSGRDVSGTFDASFTLVEQTTGGSVSDTTVPGSNITDDVSDGMNDVDPQLGLLGPNGGPTATHALPTSSPAADKGSSAGPADQRGQPRPFDIPSIANSLAAGGNGADMGSFELQVPQAPPAVPAVPAVPALGPPAAPVKAKKCKKKRKKRAAAAKKCKKKKKKK